jgi:hypothetical protein
MTDVAAVFRTVSILRCALDPSEVVSLIRNLSLRYTETWQLGCAH